MIMFHLNLNGCVMIDERTDDFAHLNEDLTQLVKELQEQIRTRDKFFSILAHDLRSPFNGILGFSNVLAEDIDLLSRDEIKNFAVQLNSSAKSLFNLLENLLLWSRIQSGRMQYKPIKMNIIEIINDIISVLIGNAVSKNISIINMVSPYHYVFADQNMLYCIIQNLISNAIKFTEGGGEIRLMSQDEGGFIEVSIADTGVGIRPEDISRIFRIDVEHSTLGTEREKGTGLGLILCKDLVYKQGGKISIESQVKIGTTFRFTLPKP